MQPIIAHQKVHKTEILTRWRVPFLLLSLPNRLTCSLKFERFFAFFPKHFLSKCTSRFASIYSSVKSRITLLSLKRFRVGSLRKKRNVPWCDRYFEIRNFFVSVLCRGSFFEATGCNATIHFFFESLSFLWFCGVAGMSCFVLLPKNVLISFNKCFPGCSSGRFGHLLII